VRKFTALPRTRQPYLRGPICKGKEGRGEEKVKGRGKGRGKGVAPGPKYFGLEQ